MKPAFYNDAEDFVRRNGNLQEAAREKSAKKMKLRVAFPTRIHGSKILLAYLTAKGVVFGANWDFLIEFELSFDDRDDSLEKATGNMKPGTFEFLHRQLFKLTNLTAFQPVFVVAAVAKEVSFWDFCNSVANLVEGGIAL